jgi:calcium-dependent protein kinase
VVVSLCLSADYDFRGEAWKTISKEAKDFISKCLRLNPAQRMTAMKASLHPWIAGYTIDNREVADLDPRIFESMNDFKREADFKKISTSVLAFGLSRNELKSLKEAFMAIDSDSNGMITLEEFQESLKSFTTEEECKDMFNSIDLDGNQH